jgi:hypothetical protein
MSEFVSPLIDGLSKLIASEGFPALESLYDAEKEILLRDLLNAKDERELFIIQGRYKNLKKMRDLPTVTVDKFLAAQKNKE